MYDWQWYNSNVLNINNKITVCGPPVSKNITNKKWIEMGYSLIECYTNPLFNIQSYKNVSKFPQNKFWKLGESDTHLAIFSFCKLKNTHLQWKNFLNPYVQIHAYCNSLPFIYKKYGVENIEHSINFNRIEINGSDHHSSQHSFKVNIHENKMQPKSPPNNEQSVIYSIMHNIGYCGGYVFTTHHKFVNLVKFSFEKNCCNFVGFSFLNK